MAKRDRTPSAAKQFVRNEVFHRAVVATEHLKAEAENSGFKNTEDPEGYAQEKTERTAKDAVETAENLGESNARKTFVKKSQQQKAVRESRMPGEAGSKESIRRRRETFKRVAFQKEAIRRQEETAARKTTSSESAQRLEKGMEQLRRNTLKREVVNRKLAEQVRKGGKLPAKPPKLPAVSMKQQIAEQLREWVKEVAMRVIRALGRIVRELAAFLVGLLGGGAVVVLLAIVVGAAAAIIGSPMGILWSDESGDPSAIPIRIIVAETNREFAEAVNDLAEEHPECSHYELHYDYEDGHTWSSYWPEVLAVFAVDNNLHGDDDVIVIDERKKQLIKDAFWEMHRIENEVETIETLVQPEDDPETEEDESQDEPYVEISYVLHITISSKSVDELAEEKQFTQDEKDILHQLLSDEMRPSLLALCGGLTDAGEITWPLPGYTNISCAFGAVDAFGSAGHKGMDLPAPAGTPIVAAHGGIVLISGWNDSYGNQVMLDGGEISTRYAHMITQAVSVGTTVTAGQVIGYVGTTGDSTGNHLHFEVRMNGALVDPLTVVQP